MVPRAGPILIRILAEYRQLFSCCIARKQSVKFSPRHATSSLCNRLRFHLFSLVSGSRCRRGGIGRRAGLKSQRLPLVTHLLPRTVANKSDRKRTETTVVLSTWRQRLRVRRDGND